MKLKFISTLFITVLLVSCGKPTRVKGVVYSKHGIPVPNAEVYYQMYKSSNYPITSTLGAKTNAQGEYDFHFTPNARRSYDVKCFCDSGYVKRWVDVGKINNVDLNLQ